MAVLPVYQDLLTALQSPPPCWPRLSPGLKGLLEGLEETYGFAPGQAAAALDQSAGALRAALAPAPGYGLEAEAGRLLAWISPHLPGPVPDLYLGCLLFLAPAATLSLNGRPAIALGLERFHPAPPPQAGTPTWYHPAQAEEMVPHEAAHAVRMQILGLPPTPRRLSLLDMVMLEGTALTFTDLLLGRVTLGTFMPPETLARHERTDREVRAAVAADFGQTGMDVFARYFGADSPISGYYAGFSLCREYLQRYGPGSVRELVGLPSPEILRRLGWRDPGTP